MARKCTELSYCLTKVMSYLMCVIPCSGLFSWVKNFREKLDKVPRIKFRGFKFRGTGGNVNFNLEHV